MAGSGDREHQPLGFLPQWVQDSSGLILPLGVTA
jgi:hypothetical protein